MLQAQITDNIVHSQQIDADLHTENVRSCGIVVAALMSPKPLSSSEQAYSWSSSAQGTQISCLMLTVECCTACLPAAEVAC
jgi:hypothetical protein